MKNEIQSLEEQLRLAMLTSNIEELNLILSDDLIFTNHLGQVMSKNDDLEGHRSGLLNIESIELLEQVIQEFENTSVASSLLEIKGTYKQEPANGRFRFTRVWIKKNNLWQMMAGHSCLVA